MIEPIKLLAAIIQEELGLAEGQIMLENQKYEIPKTPGLYVVLSYLSGKAIGNNNYAESTATGMQEVQETTMRYQIQIDAMSADNSARTRKEEIIMALNSQRAQRSQDLNLFQIGSVPSEFSNVGSLEETVRLNRYVLTVALTALVRKVKDLSEYYDKFNPPEVAVNE